MRHIKTEAIIIKRRNYNEADRILTIFTKHLGKMTVKAAGVRRIQSRRASHIELLNYSELSLYKGSNIPVLTEAVTINEFSLIKSDLTKVGFAYHLCELIDGLCPDNQENTAVFNLLVEVMKRLEGDENVVSAIHEFEIELLSLLGYWNNQHVLSQKLDTQTFIENILERRLKSRSIFSKITRENA